MTSSKNYKLGQMLSNEEAIALLSKKYGPKAGGGWFNDCGTEVYICDGSHRDGTRGFKVLQIGGLR